VRTDPLSVLLVEDDPDVLEATSLVLEGEGFTVHTARDLASARALGAAHPGCITLLDLSLDGDLAAFIPELRALCRGPVLLFSAGDRLSEKAAALGADGAVPKPFDIDRLVHLLYLARDGAPVTASP
jgi:DNA-binding response OmpR family regulator